MAEKRFLKVFLSYAHDDRDTVKELYNRLKADRVDVWLDKVELLPGQVWKHEIHKALREADVVIVCLSCHYDDKGFRHQEVRIALEEAASQHEGEIFIIPARLEECEPLESLEQWQWVDLFEADGHERLMGALKMRADSIGAELKIGRRRTSSPHEKMVTNEITGTGNSLPPNQKKSPIVHSDESASQLSPQSITSPQQSAVPKPKDRKTLKTEYIVAFIGAIATLLGGILASPALEAWLTSPTTSTSTATFTELPTHTLIIVPSNTTTPTIPPVATATYTSIPTLTKTFTLTATFTPRPTYTLPPSSTTKPLTNYSCVTVNEQPAENSQIRRGKNFKVYFTVINNGDIAWPEGLTLDIASNSYNIVSAPSLPKKVPRVQPGDSIVVGPFDAKAPEKDGHYVVSFKIGDDFCWPYVVFNVVK